MGGKADIADDARFLQLHGIVHDAAVHHPGNIFVLVHKMDDAQVAVIRAVLFQFQRKSILYL